MKILAFPSAHAFLLVALPLCAVVASAQSQRSSVTSFDKNGRAIIQETSGDENRSSVTTFDKNGVPKITYTSPPLYPNPNPSGLQTPHSIAGLIANQNIYGQSAPIYSGGYNRFSYSNAQVYPPGYFPYPAPNYGYPAPGYGYPVPGYQQSPTSIDFRDPKFPWSTPTNITTIPLTPGYAYPAPVYPYPYPAPTYGYPAPTYGYPYGGGYGYGGGTYASNSANYGISFGRGGFSASIGGSNASSRSSTTTTITTY